MYSIIEELRGKIVHIYYDGFGKKHFKKVPFTPIIGFETEKNSKWKTYDGKSIRLKELESFEQYYNYQYHESEMMNIYGMINPKYQFISENYKEDIKPKLQFIKSAIIDIEVYSEDGFPDPEFAMWPITSITVKDNKTGKFYVAATKPYNKVKNVHGIDPSRINFRRFEMEEDLMNWLIKVFNFIKPDILCGWYSNNFDFPYIINRYDYLFEDENVKKGLSPIGGRVSSNKLKNGRDFRNTIAGITLFDYLELYKKYIFTPRASYKLDFIADVELGDQKLDYSEYDNLNELWIHNPQKYIDYNVYDVELIDLLDKKLGLINLACTVAYKAKCNFVDVMGVIRVWDVLFYNYLKKYNIVIPPKRDHEHVEYPGAYVKEPVPAIYDWVVSYDLNSLYPHLQQQFNISPETLIKGECLKVNQDEVDERFFNKDLVGSTEHILSANGYYFRKDMEGFVPRILREIYSERSTIKDEMLRKKQIFEDVKNELKQMLRKKQIFEDVKNELKQRNV